MKIFRLLLCLALWSGSLVASPALFLELTSNQATVHAPAGAPVILESSEDLSSWHGLANGLADGGQFKVGITFAGKRFFRARSGATVLKSSVNSFNVEVHPELVEVPDGRIWIVPPRTVSVRTGTNYLAGDLFDGQLHVLQRRIHEGAVYFAKVIADTNGITWIEPIPAVFPTTAIPKSKAAIAAHHPLRVVLIGDSLTEGAGGSAASEHWAPMIFDGADPPNIWSLIGQANPLSYSVFGVGGIGAEYGLVVTGAGSPVLTSGFDLAIVGFGANAGLGDAPLVEAMVHSLRAAGIEVILQTGEKRFDGNPTPFLDNTALFEDIAAAQGCTIADTYSYMLETDGTYSVDQIHPSVLGHQVWAGCVRSVLNGLNAGARPNAPSSAIATLASLPISLRNCFPNSATVQFIPLTSSGVAGPASFYNSIGPSLGGRPPANALTVLTNGQRATFHSDSACAVSLITECLNGESAEVKVDFGNGDPGALLAFKGTFATRLTAAASIGTWPTNRPVDLTVTVTSGLLRLTGVSFPVRR